MALGLICKARIEFDWDNERDRHTQMLMVGARQGLERTTLEGVQFASDGLAVYHKMMGDKFRKYLQTGDQSVLGEFKDMSFKQYRDMVTTLRRLIGKEDKDPAAQARQTATATPVPETITVVPTHLPIPDGPLTGDVAAFLLEALNKDKVIQLKKGEE